MVQRQPFLRKLLNLNLFSNLPIFDGMPEHLADPKLRESYPSNDDVTFLEKH